jgi:hypothetical protein
MKKLYTTKFHNFLRHTTFMFAVSPFEVVYKFFFKKKTTAVGHGGCMTAGCRLPWGQI